MDVKDWKKDTVKRKRQDLPLSWSSPNVKFIKEKSDHL